MGCVLDVKFHFFEQSLRTGKWLLLLYNYYYDLLESSFENGKFHPIFLAELIRIEPCLGLGVVVETAGLLGLDRLTTVRLLARLMTGRFLTRLRTVR